ncbi:hypothetical protein [Aestuariivita boseongensis]|nr:hypothetical protein [Aestuariivita boseongensis]
MSAEVLIPVFAGLTFAAVLLWAFVGKQNTEDIKKDLFPSERKSEKEER